MDGDLREHLVHYFEEHHKLVESAALQLLLADGQPMVVSRELVERSEAASPFVTREMVEAALARRAPPSAGPPRAGPDRPTLPRLSFELLREGFSGPPVASQPLAAYEALFRSRFRLLARMLRGRPVLGNLRPIRELRPAEGFASVIGMLRQVRETPQRHHLIVTVDDESGSLEVLVPKDSPGSRIPFLPDEVIGLRLQFGKEPGRLPRAVSVERPDVPPNRTPGR